MRRKKKEGEKASKYIRRPVVFFLCLGTLLSACGNTKSADLHAPDSVEDSASQVINEDPLSEFPPTETFKYEETQQPTETEEPMYDLAWFLELPEISELSLEQQKTAQRLYEDGILEGGVMELVALLVEDMDENGQYDCVAMLHDTRDPNPYGHGCVYLYYNEERPYRFYNEYWPYIWGFNAQWADLTGDGRLEFVLETFGTGVGASGDWYIAVLSDTGEGIRELEFPPVPEELATEYSPGLLIDVYMETEENLYSAYCPYLEESITFQATWTDYGRSWDATEPIAVGGNVRGFFDSVFEEKDGKNRLIVAEYLSGEGGTVHCVGLACFAIVWDEDGTSRIQEWWIESVETYQKWFWNNFPG